MKSAKEMFYKLGYEIIRNDSDCIQYEFCMNEICRRYITFIKKEKRYNFFEIVKDTIALSGYGFGEGTILKMHKAIHKQLEELGWL